MPGTADTKACPFCGEQILAVAIKCKYCRSELARVPRSARAAADVPWYRRTTAVLLLFLLFVPAAALILLTGPVYRVRDGRAITWRGWGRPAATLVSVGFCVALALVLVGALRQPDCRSSDVEQLLGELVQRQMTEAQGLLASTVPSAQGGLKMSVNLTDARETQGGKVKRCAATAHLKVIFPKLDEPFEGSSELRYAVDPAGWAKVYVHVPDAEWIQSAFGMALSRYAQRTAATPAAPVQTR